MAHEAIGRECQRGRYVIRRVGNWTVSLWMIFGNRREGVAPDIGTATAEHFGFDLTDPEVAAVFCDHPEAWKRPAKVIQRSD